MVERLKTIAWLAWPLGALLLLSAHFYRADRMPLAALAVAIGALLFVPRAWAARAAQIALALGAFEWLRALAGFAAMRVAAGQPYLRLALILGAVAVFTAGAIFVFRAYRLRVRYGLGKRI
jgi:hypothetical protein